MRVLLADDQKHVRAALQALLKHELDVSVAGEAGEAENLLAQIRAIHPDLVLLDWELPGLAAIGSVPTLRTICPDLMIIALSVRSETGQEALSAGADAFISKVDPPERLLATLHDMDRNRAAVGD